MEALEMMISEYDPHRSSQKFVVNGETVSIAVPMGEYRDGVKSWIRFWRCATVKNMSSENYPWYIDIDVPIKELTPQAIIDCVNSRIASRVIDE